MIRVLIDEDTAMQLLSPQRRVLLGHDVHHVTDVGWSGKKDEPVLLDAGGAGYHVLLTRDSRQLTDPRLCDAIKKSGLHHVRYDQGQGPSA
jgi:hypothetical protein